MRSRSVISILLIASIIFLATACGGGGGSGNAVSDVFTVNYNANGADSGIYTPEGQISKGEEVVISDNTGNLVKYGYLFDGWNTKADGSGKSYAPGAKYKGENLLLYAKWAPIYEVLLMSGGSPSPALEQVPVLPGGFFLQITGLTAKGKQLSVLNIPGTIDGNPVSIIGDNAFKDCTNLTSVTIPTSVAWIMANVFQGCSNLEGIIMESWTPPEADPAFLGGCPATIYVPDDVVAAYKAAEGWNSDPSRILSSEPHTVTFDGQGATTPANPSSMTVAPPAQTVGTLPAAPKKTGYNFGGWYTGTGGTGTEFTADTVVTGNITIFAKWDSYNYTVNFDDQGATTPVSPASKTVNSPATTIDSLPANPAKNGQIFMGWYTQTAGGGTQFTASTPVTGNITVYAYWADYSYTVTFDDQGATTHVNPASKTVNSPATTVGSLPTAPEKTDYVFGGWYTQPGGAGYEFTALTVVLGNITVYAKWNPVYTVTFDGQGATTPASPTTKMVIPPATTVGSLPTAPEKTNNGFGGWYTQPGGAGDEFTAGTTVTGNITVYAKWIPGHIVTFDDQGATTPVSPTTKTVIPPATTVGSLPTAPQKTGFVFGGWYTQAGGGGSEFTAGTPVTGNITVYAKWDSYSYTVNFDDQGATTPVSPASKTVNSPATTVGSLPTPPQKTGFAFGGWYTQTCGGGSEFTAGTAVNGNITVYAKWTLDNMVAIPGKTYKMLSTEVTQGLYTSVMGSNPSYNKAGDNYPVEKVTWYDAAAFCNALSTEMGLAPVYTINGNDVTQDISKNGFRLPTIEEWVYSGKGGQNYTYAGSNTPGEVAWYIANANSTTHPVGQKNPNGYGLYDMTGNVSEWCWDSRKPEQIIYHYVKGSNYSTGSGASFNDINDNETEVYYGPNDKYDYLGFRIVCKQ